jgi:hypothetical protein
LIVRAIGRTKKLGHAAWQNQLECFASDGNTLIDATDNSSATAAGITAFFAERGNAQGHDEP